MVEPIITLGKKPSLSNRRLAFNRLRDRDMVVKLFDELGPRFASRNGGYLRILKFGFRQGDNAPMALIELLDRPRVARSSKRATPSKRFQNRLKRPKRCFGLFYSRCRASGRDRQADRASARTESLDLPPILLRRAATSPACRLGRDTASFVQSGTGSDTFFALAVEALRAHRRAAVRRDRDNGEAEWLPSLVKLISSPAPTSRARFARTPFTLTFPASMLSLARLRVLKNLATQSHLSSRIRSLDSAMSLLYRAFLQLALERPAMHLQGACG